jgi:hypothetical protein
MVLSESSHYLARGQINSLWLTMGIVFSIMMISYLSAKVGMVAILVVTIPTITAFGIMGWFGIELNMATGLIASIAIGLAEDNTTHYLIRYRREFKKDLDKDRALRDTIASVGRPIVSMTLVICIGFSFLLFSHFVPTAVFGFLMIVTMMAATAGNLILLPSLMLHVELVTVWDMLRLMPSLSGMSSDVAHELNQPLNAIKMGSEYLKIMLQQEGRIEPHLLFEVAQEIDTQVDRASGIINRLRVRGKTGFCQGISGHQPPDPRYGGHIATSTGTGKYRYRSGAFLRIADDFSTSSPAGTGVLQSDRQCRRSHPKAAGNRPILRVCDKHSELC